MLDTNKMDPAIDSMLARADALVPVLRARAAEAEALGRCPDATVADYVETGLLRVCQPIAYGGYEMGYDVLCDVIQRLAHGCASQAWVYMVLADNPLKLATFSKQAQDDVWGLDTTKRIGVAVAAVGKGKPVDGGILWSGTHGFSSGIDHVHWLICGGFIEHDGERRGCMALIPRSDVTVIEDWNVVGLAGTGSKSFVVKDAFVPAHRIIDKKDYDAGTTPGAALYNSPVFRMPRGGVSAASYAAVALGAAQAMLQTFCEYTGSRKSRGKVVADDVGTQMTVGLASSELEAAERMYMGALRETMQVLERGEKVTRDQQVQGKRNCCYAAQLAMAAAHRIFNSAGGRALFNDNVMQRQFRDCFAASAHHSLSWDSASAEYGKHQLAQYR
ncbi:MAG: acyl-CoA dehydrogenase [Hyphomicrobiales bacterium]|nr:acyl-CoA dehydrogenase [Hyphomicrobiales bacterium]